MVCIRTVAGTAALIMSAAGALLAGSASPAHASALCRSYSSQCASSQSCEPIYDEGGAGIRCTTTYVYYGRGTAIE